MAYTNIPESKVQDIKRKLALRKLRKEDIYHINGKELSLLQDNVIFDLYFKTFGEEVQRRTRAYRSDKITGYIYIIGNMEECVCKIGYSAKPKVRIKELQTGCPFKLSILKLFRGNIPKEKQLHIKYQHLKLHGEWFTIDEVLRDIIKKG